MSGRVKERIRDEFGQRVQENVKLANLTTARVGGPADALITIHNKDELEKIVRLIWEVGVKYFILGSGSNIVVSDLGFRGIVILNQARKIKIDSTSNPPVIRAESGANFSMVARQAAANGLSGLEWASTIPGTVGGAVYGNAGAYGSDMSDNLVVAEILHQDSGKQLWDCDQMQYQYRTSALKKDPGKAVVLETVLKLEVSTREEVQAKMSELSAKRRNAQPPGASMGSMFKNPPDDFAGRLIEAAGLKGLKIGDAEISKKHANFFINHGSASAEDIKKLIGTAQDTVQKKFGVHLELEIEMIGEWKNGKDNEQERGQ